MSMYDEYGDPIELNDFYFAIEQALRKNGVPTASELIEKGSKPFPKLPKEFDGNDYEDIIPDGDVPF